MSWPESSSKSNTAGSAGSPVEVSSRASFLFIGCLLQQLPEEFHEVVGCVLGLRRHSVKVMASKVMALKGILMMFSVKSIV